MAPLSFKDGAATFGFGGTTGLVEAPPANGLASDGAGVTVDIDGERLSGWVVMIGAEKSFGSAPLLGKDRDDGGMGNMSARGPETLAPPTPLIPPDGLALIPALISWLALWPRP